MQLLDIFIMIFVGTILANFVIETSVDTYMYIKRKLRDEDKWKK